MLLEDSDLIGRKNRFRSMVPSRLSSLVMGGIHSNKEKFNLGFFMIMAAFASTFSYEPPAIWKLRSCYDSRYTYISYTLYISL